MGLRIPTSTSVPLPIIFVAALVCGCAATPYQPLSDGADAREGFSETLLGTNIYEVNFRGNSNTSRERASDFALLRAAELCLLNGYSYFVVTSSRDMATTAAHATDQAARTTSPANVFGFTPAGASTSTYRGAPRTTYTRPRPSVVVGFLEEPREDLGPIYDAVSLKDSIRTKYQMAQLETLGDVRGY